MRDAAPRRRAGASGGRRRDCRRGPRAPCPRAGAIRGRGCVRRRGLRRRGRARSPRRSTEATLARDPVEELEAEAVGGVDPLEGLDAEMRPVGVPPSETTTSFQRSSATAAQSNPAPRLAVVAGARTENLTLLPRLWRPDRGTRPEGSRGGPRRPGPEAVAVIAQTTRAPRSGARAHDRCQPRGGRRLAEDAFQLGEVAPCGEDFLV